MSVSLPYLVSYKNVPTLFEKIASAKIPEKFNREFLQTTIGLKASNDRALIPLLRNFGFIDASGTPTQSYRQLKGGNKRAAVAVGIRKAYGPLFDADQQAYKLSSDKLKSLVAQVAGTDDDMTSRIAGTFAALIKLGDFEADAPNDAEEKEKDTKDELMRVTVPIVNPRQRDFELNFITTFRFIYPQTGRKKRILTFSTHSGRPSNEGGLIGGSISSAWSGRRQSCR
jgi:hypothetical protein